MAQPQILALLIGGGHLRRSAVLVALALAAALTEGLGLVLFVPLLSRLGGGDTGPPLATILVAFVVLAVLRAMLGYWRQVVTVRLRGEVVDRLRARAWNALLHADWRTLRESRRSDSASLLISEIDRIGVALSDGLSAISLAATLLAVLAAGLLIAPVPMLVAGALGFAALPLLRRRRAGAIGFGEAIGAAYAEIHATSGEALAGLRAIKTLNAENQTAARIDRAQQSLRRAEQGFWRLQGLGQVLLQGGAAAVLAGFVWLSVTRLGTGPAELVPLAAVVVRAVPLLGGLHDAWLQWVHAHPSLAAEQALFERFAVVRERGADGANPLVLQREIGLHDVSVRFSSESAPTLHGVSLTLPVHSITAVEGPSGAGKSTLADVLAGLIAPDSGTVTIDGQAIDAALLRGWRGQVAYVPQEPLVFAGSIRDNLLLAAPRASEPMLIAAVQAAAAAFVLTLPGGLDCQVGDGGRSLSGGELQRLMLARALLRKPALLILDEATSALDPANEALVAGAIAALRGAMTIVIIAHHGSLSALADQKVRLDLGRITAIEQLRNNA